MNGLTRFALLRRGFVDQATMHAGTFAKRHAALFDREPVRVVRFTVALSNPDVRRAALACPGLARLRGVDVYGPGLRDDAAREVLAAEGLVGVRELGLRHFTGVVAALPFVKNLTNLTRLDLSGSGELRRRLDRGLAGWDGALPLEALDLSMTGVSGPDVRALAGCPALANLRELSLARTRWSQQEDPCGDDALIALANAPPCGASSA